MKRSSKIRLVLLGGLCTGAFTACGPSGTQDQAIASARVYPNDYHVPSLGYYHAPYHAWFPLPYNDYDPKTRRYYHGGLWTAEPDRSIVNLSEPSSDALRALDVATQTVRRGGWGSTSQGHYFSS
jgi:hypothetical protein